MNEILITSSVLILALLLLRRLFRDKIPRRLQYALWGLVLLRLLVPVSLPAADFSLLTAVEPVTANMESLYIAPNAVTLWGQNNTPVFGGPHIPDVAVGPATPSNTYTFPSQDALGNPIQVETEFNYQFSLDSLLRPLWYGGIILMTCWMLFTNLRFWRKLRKVRIPYPVENCRHPIYLVETGLPSPCLFGLFRPAIYLTPAAIASPDTLRHVLAHEETHARHRDSLWALLRSVCLAVYWFDPLVWWAAVASRTDCELACDEGALRRLGESERIPYGRTLLSLIPVRKTPANPLLSATTMTAGKRQLKERISRIAENRKTARTALFAAALLAALSCAVTFTGAKTAEPLSDEEVSKLLDYVMDEDEDGFIRAAFMTTLFDNPQYINCSELFYGGAGLDGEDISDQERRMLEDTYDISTDSNQRLIKLNSETIRSLIHKYTGRSSFSISVRGDVFSPVDYMYLDGYDAYYQLFDPGFNQRSISLTNGSGEQDGDLIHFYYHGSISNGLRSFSGSFCLTLKEQPGGGYWFVSNKLLENQNENSFHSLTADELAYFNGDFFTEPYGIGQNNLRAQFLTSLYDRPDDIDLFQLLYNGGARPDAVSPEERNMVVAAGYGGLDPETDLTKISYENMMELLEANTGLTSLSNPVGLENFLHLPEYNAYYHFHGDTNAEPVTFTSGTRDGNWIHLYYNGSVFHNGQALFDSFHLTLEEQPNGAYWFISNQLVEALPTAYPAWEPELTIPLNNVQPYDAPAVELKTYGGRYTQMLGGESTGVDLYTVCVMQTENGNVHFGVQDTRLSSWPSTYFLESSDFNYPIKRFENLFGHEGLVITYTSNAETLTDYYYFQEDGTPVLLLRSVNDSWINHPLDLNGDGEKEVIAGPWEERCLYFQRDGQIYQANLRALLTDAWPKGQSLHFGSLDTDGRYVNLYASVPFDGTHDPTGTQLGTAFRYLYFDGENLLLYKDQRLYPNHFAEGIQVSPEVQEAVKRMVSEKMESEAKGWRLVDGDFVPMPLQYDDWRVSLLEGSYINTFCGQIFQVWRIDYQLHTNTPEYVIMAGGRYVTDDGWVSPGYPGCDWLIFQLKEDGSRNYLYSTMANDCTPDSETFWIDEFPTLETLGLVSMDQLDGPNLLTLFARDPSRFLNDLAERSEAQQEMILQSLTEIVAAVNAEDGEWKSAAYEQWARIVDDLRLSGNNVSDAGKAVWNRLNDLVAKQLELAEPSHYKPTRHLIK